MFKFLLKQICIILLIQTSLGQLPDFDYAYQELIENEQDFESIPQKQNIDIDKLPIDTIEEICKNYLITKNNQEITYSNINCLELFKEDDKEIKLIKREVKENEELEGSGDSNKIEDEVTNKDNSTENCVQTESTTIGEYSPTVTEVTKEIQTEASNATTITTTTGKPLEYKNGFDEILKNAQQLNLTVTVEPTSELDKNNKSNNNILLTSKNKNAPIKLHEEIVKTGESKEKPKQSATNDALLLTFLALGIVGVAAFVFNYIKQKKQNKEIDEVMKLENEGKELKEMKPLMKNSLQQNGSKSLEYIDAELQEHNDTRIDIDGVNT